MWGSSAVRGASLSSLVDDSGQAEWLKAELAEPTMQRREWENQGGILTRAIDGLEFRIRQKSFVDLSSLYLLFRTRWLTCMGVRGRKGGNETRFTLGVFKFGFTKS